MPPPPKNSPINIINRQRSTNNGIVKNTLDIMLEIPAYAGMTVRGFAMLGGCWGIVFTLTPPLSFAGTCINRWCAMTMFLGILLFGVLQALGQSDGECLSCCQ